MRCLVTILLLFVMSWQFAFAQIPSWSCSATDIDQDDNGLIDICYLEGLNAIRYQLDGTGYRATSTATLITAGCPIVGGMEQCNGYELARDLDFLGDASYSSTSNKVIWTQGEGWQPIVGNNNEPFNSTFMGNDRTISNLMINRPDASFVGLFSRSGSSSTIINLRLSDISVKGHNQVGGCVGRNLSGSIANSYVGGSVQGNGMIGGLVGSNSSSRIDNSHVNGSVKGNIYVGGLIGFNDSSRAVNSRIDNSSASGGVVGTSHVGGLVGFNHSYNHIISSYATNNVIGRYSYTGGLIGVNTGSISNSYATGNVAGISHVGGLIGGHQLNTVDGSYATGNVTGGNFVGGLSGINEGGNITNSYAEGDVTGDSYVGGLSGLTTRGNITDSYAKGDVVGASDNVGGLVGRNGIEITIINSYAEGDVTGYNSVGGLIGSIDYANEIINSYAEGDVTGYNSVGGLIGSKASDNETINSYAEGDVTGNNNVGGLIGFIDYENETINSYAEGDVTGNSWVGGLIGSKEFDNETINSYAEGDVAGNRWVGGLVGFIQEGEITNTYAEGDVTGVTAVGGLVASSLFTSINNAYAGGSVTGTNTVGGLVASATRGNINNSYARGSVTGTNEVGGLAGLLGNTNVTNSYWDIEASGILTSAGGTSKTTVELQLPTETGSIATEIYYGWNAGDWHFGTDKQYPALRYTEGSNANNPACGSAVNLPDCGALLSGQRVGLATLSLLGDPILLPPFSSETRDYRVISSTRLGRIQLIPTAVNSSATITVHGSAGFSITVASGTTSSAIPLSMTTSTLITVEVAEENGKQVRYTLDVNNSTFNEGERIVLDGAALYGVDRDSLSYQWTQVSGVSLLSGLATNQAVLDIKLREDLINKTSDTVIVVLRLAVSEAGTVIDSEDVTLTIMKVNNGFIRLSAAPTLQGLVLTAPEIDLSADPDGTGSLDADSYQWQEHATGSHSWVDVGSQAKTYEIATNTAMNTKYRVQFNYSDGQGYVRHLVSQVFTYNLDIDADGDGLIEINDLEDLNAMRYQLDGTGYKASDAASKITTGCPPGGCKGYELVRDLDFGNDRSYGLGIANKRGWTSGLGWQPIGTSDAPFNSIFQANNHTISNLYINRAYTQDYVGLFGATGDKAEIADVGLLDVDITGRNIVGGLVGYKRGGSVSNSYVTGRVAGENLYDVGGLVGWHQGGTITDTHTSSTVVGIGTNAGGLVGDNDRGTITDSYALGSVVADENSGGLVGSNTGTITRSQASVAVEGSDAAGGLVGHNRGIITNSQATGSVTGNADVGGLAGWSAGDITNSYAIGAVSGDAGVGGLIGNNLRGTITNSYARGDVLGMRQYIGGLVGWNSAGTITDSYARGDVSGQEDVGGLVGVNNLSTGRIAKSYAAGRVVGTEDAGGLVGENRRGTITKSYWNRTNNPTTTSVGGTPKTMVELQTPTAAGSIATEIYYGWSQDDWDFATTTLYPILKHAVGPDTANPACGTTNDLPTCDTLLSGQLPSVGLLGLTLSEGAMLSPRFDIAVYNYHVNVKADARFLTVQFTASDADARISISTDGGFVADNATSGTRISLNTNSATIITISVMAEYNATSEYKLYVNRIPEIVAMGLDTSVVIKAGREHAIDVTVSDADRDDVLTLSLRAVDENQGVVELTIMDAVVSATGSAERDRQSLGIKGLQTGSTMLALTVSDDNGASATVMLTVTVTANTAPTISGLSDIRLLTGAERTLDVTLNDEDDDDDATRLIARVESSNDAIAMARIAEMGDATRVLTVNAGSTAGTATITVFVDDGRGVANSVISETFEVAVEANEAPMLEIKSPRNQTIMLGSTASLVVSVADANFDANDNVALEVMSSTSTVSVEPADIVDIRGDTDKTFVLTGVKAGTAMISITATDSEGESVSETVSVHVNAPPTIAIDDDEVTVKAGREIPIDVTVSDANREDVLTLLLSATDENQDIVELATTSVTVLVNGNAEREQQSFSIKGSKAGRTDLELTVSDDKGASETVMLTVMVTANTTPTISGLSDIKLLTSSETILTVTLGDADDDDDVSRLKASAESNNAAIATASIAEMGDATRVLTVTAGSMVGTATITVLVDDGREVANSVSSETFKVVVEAEEAPIIGTLAPKSVEEGDTIDASKAVSDANNDDLSYQWEITDEADGSTINIDDSPLFVVPTDLVKPPAEATTLTLMLTVSDGRTDVSTSVSVLVKRKDNGAVIPTVLIREGQKLIPPTIDQDDDPDGGVTSATYVWQRCSANCSADGDWSDIGEASDTADAYTITKADEQVGYSFRLKVRYKDGQGYEYVIFFYNSGIRIRAKVFLEGPLQ